MALLAQDHGRSAVRDISADYSPARHSALTQHSSAELERTWVQDKTVVARVRPSHEGRGNPTPLRHDLLVDNQPSGVGSTIVRWNSRTP